MAKTADRYFGVDPWAITEDGFDPKHSKIAESVFSLANEFMGVRGFFEEDYSGDSLIGSYFNGVYDAERLSRNAYKGVVLETEFMANAVNWLALHIRLDGEILDLARVKFRDFQRQLDLRTGLLTRRFIWETAEGKQTDLCFERIVSMNEVNLGAQRVTVTPLNYSGVIELTAETDLSLLHEMYGRNCWKETGVQTGREGDVYTLAISGKTRFRDKPLASLQVLRIDGRVTGSETVTEGSDGSKAAWAFAIGGCEGQDIVFERIVWNDKDAGNAKESGLKRALTADFDALLRSNADWWGRVWRDCDIRIDGDDENQQGVRFCIFQLFQTYHGVDGKNNIGAKGLTGEGYNGNAFWDTETYCLPFFIFNNQKAARNLLEFRYATLPEALDRAAALDCSGAFYPIATISGLECCNLWQHASLQLQASTGVAYGIWDYVKLTQDREFLYSRGLEMLVQISRMLATRGAWSADGSHYSYYCVMGPDEFEMMVNHNYYTNFMGKFTLEYTLQELGVMEKEDPAAYEALAGRLKLTADERAEWENIARHILLLYHEDTKLFEQHENFFDLPHVDVDSIPDSDFPLYEHWTYDRIYRNDIIKQPDVLMAMLLFNSRYTKEQLRANYEFYEPRCIHESSLSPSVHSILAAQLGKYQEALDFFGFATRMDLDNYNRNSGDGLHTTSIAAAWMNIVYGFGGMRSDGDVLSFDPWIPAGWKGYLFHVNYRGAVITVEVDQEKAHIGVRFDQNADGNADAAGAQSCLSVRKSITIRAAGQLRELTEDGITIKLGA